MFAESAANVYSGMTMSSESLGDGNFVHGGCFERGSVAVSIAADT
jgi:hypothetical protein